MKRFIPLVLLGLIVATVIFAQVLGDGEFANLLAEDSFTVGDNTDKDVTALSIDTLTDNYDITYVNGDTQIRWITPTNGLRIDTVTNNPTLAFYDGDLSGASPVTHGAMLVVTADATVGDEFTTYDFEALGNGGLRNIGRFEFTEEDIVGSDSAVASFKLSTWAAASQKTAGIQSYTGTVGSGAGADYIFGDGEDYFIDNDLHPDTDNTYYLGSTTYAWKGLNLGTGGAVVEDADNDGALDITVDVPIVFSTFQDINTKFVANRLHGNFINLKTAQTIDNSPTDITSTPGISKMLLVVNTCSDSVGTITATGTSVNRDTKAETASDTDAIAIAGTTFNSITTDAQGNTKFSATNAYITSKWFTGLVTFSTSDVNCTDVDVYQIAFEQVNDQSNLSLETLDISSYITNSSGWLVAYLYLLEVTGSVADISIAGQVVIDPPTANKQYRLRHGALNAAFDGSTDGFWLEVHLGGSGSNVYHESLNTKVWVTQTINVN